MELPKILSKFDTEKPPPPSPPESEERIRKVSPMTFAIALTVNAVVSAILAVFLTLSFMRDDLAKNTARPESVQIEPAPVAAAAATQPAPAETARAAMDGSSAPAPERSAALVKERAAPKPPPAAEPVTGFTVADTVELPFGKPGRLAFRLTPDTARRERLLVSFEGLPAGSGIYGLVRFGENIWRLDPGQSTEMLVIIPPDAPKAFSLKMGLHREQGALIAVRSVRIVAKR